MKELIKASLQWSWLILARLLGIITGLVVVAIAIPFRREDISKSDGRRIINLPKWAWLWGNDFDGLLGDKREWWANNTPFGWKVDSYMAMYWWAAIRNPANNMRFLDMFSAPVSVPARVYWKGDYIVEDKVGMDGWQLVISSDNGKDKYGFYFVKCWNDARAFVVRIGFKIKPSHDESVDEPRKGLTFKINPYKDIT
jgi:hypothetical protein